MKTGRGIVLRGWMTFCLMVLATAAQAADVLISSLVDNPDPAIRGGTITYTMEVQNQLADVATNVVLTFPIPSTTSFVSVDNGACGLSGTDVVCNFGDMLGTAAVPPGPVETVNVVIRTSDTTGNVVNVQASVSANNDANPSNDQRSQNTTIDDGADLTLLMFANPDPVAGSEILTYNTAIWNLGPNVASNVRVVFDLSPNLTYVSGSASGSGWSCSYDSGSHQVTCTRASLASSTTPSTITFSGRVTSGLVGGTLTSTGTVSSDTGDPDPNNNVLATDVTIGQGADLSITGSASPASVVEGDTFTVTLRPRNNGPHDSDNVVVDYTIPNGFTVATSPSGPGWSCTVSGQQVQCTRASYAPGSSDDITLDLVAPGVSGTPTDFTNTVSISSTTPDGDASNDSDSFTLHVDPDGVDLAISKSKSPQPVAQGSPITATITVHNNGPRDAAAGTITVTDTLAAGETFVSVSGTDWTCDTSVLPTITCSYGAVLANGADTSDLVIQTTATGIGDLTDNATVSYSDTPSDYNNANDSIDGTVTSTSAVADLQLTKTADADNSDGDTSTLANTEPTIVYTLTVYNDGPDAADGIVLRDPIPGYVSGGTTVAVTSAPANYSCTTGSTVICTQTSGSLAAGDSDVFQISVTRPLLDGNQTNAASAYSTTVGDDDRSNNTASITVNVAPVADVEVQSKTVTPNPVRAGVEATYVITVRNNGPSTAQNVLLLDSFNLDAADSGFTVISVAPSTGGCNGLTPGVSYTASDNPQLSCNFGNMARNTTETVTLKIRPNHMDTPPSPREFQNTATAGSIGTHDDDISNNSLGPVTLAIDPSLVDVLVDNSDHPDPVGWDPANGGDNSNNDVVYDVRFANRGPSYATGVHFDYTMTPKAGKTVRFECDEANAADPCGTSADTCTVISGSNPVTGPNTLTLRCSATTVAGKSDEMSANSIGHRYLRFRVISQPDTTGDTHQTNAAIAANENETETANNQENEDTSVRARVDLVVQKTPTPASVQLDQPFVWTITVRNDGPLASTQTDLTDTLPANMVFHGTPDWNNSTDGSSGTCTTSGQDLACDFGAVSVGATVTVQVPVMIVAYSGATVQNCATATTDGVDPNPADNTDVCGTVALVNSHYPADYGDAPDTTDGTGPGNYATRLLGGGPRHLDPGGTWLGDCVDADDGTLQNSAADADDVDVGAVQAGACSGNDDEDGVTLPPAFVADTSATLQIRVSGNDCALDGWIDFNADGDFDDAGERIFNALVLTPGSHSRTIAVPAALTVGTSYARFRCSAAGGLSPVEEVTGGEVEDYRISLQPNVNAPTTPTDYGDAPDPAVGTGPGNYRTLLSDDGASHVLGVPNAPYLGSCVDSDSTTHQNATADADDGDGASGSPPTTVGTCATPGDDEDGVTFYTQFTPGSVANLSVTASSGTNDCILNAWIDFNADGDFDDAGERIAANQTLGSGTTTLLTPLVPAGAVIGPTYARFRCASSGGLNWYGAAPDGEVEDYRVEIHPDLAAVPVDWGDAPDATGGEATGDYSTTRAHNGASHVLDATGPWLGACVDSDDGTAQNADADADDQGAAAGVVTTLGTCATAGDDEDGVTVVGQLWQGAASRVEITVGGAGSCVLNGWIDFDQNGRFDASEQVIVNRTQAAGTTDVYAFTPPVNARLGETYARFRCSTTASLGPLGPAPDGEVEDYKVTIHKAQSIPTLGGVALALLGLALIGLGAVGLRRHGMLS